MYFRPPSAGGLCDGVMMMPSARAAAGFALCVRIAWLSAGVGVQPLRASARIATPFPANTSSTVSWAGSERAWVSFPTKIGPVICWPARYSTMAWVIAAMWFSLKEPFSEDPRCPEVPKATFWAGFSTSGWMEK